MSSPIPPVSGEEKRAPAMLWEVGYEYLVDSMRSDDTPANRTHAAQVAGLFFAAAQSRALVEMVGHLADVPEQLRITNVIAAIAAVRSGSTGLIDFVDGDAEAAELYVRAHIGNIANPDLHGGQS